MDELTSFIGESDKLISIFLGTDPYTNNDLKNLSAVCTCFTDVACWQFADCFQCRPRDKSQLQIPNDSLNWLWAEIAKGIQRDSQQIQWAT